MQHRDWRIRITDILDAINKIHRGKPSRKPTKRFAPHARLLEPIWDGVRARKPRHLVFVPHPAHWSNFVLFGDFR